MKKVDLHTHSTCSDGSDKPELLAEKGKSCGLSLMALTDHDLLDGIPDFLNTCKKLGMNATGGVELSTECHTGELHILGLGVDADNKNLKDALAQMFISRNERNDKMFKALNENGVDLTETEVKKFAGMRLISRAHVAQALVAKKYCGSIAEAFAKFLRKGAIAYVPRFLFAPQKCICLIREANGIPVVAHPFSIAENPEPELKKLKDSGIEAMECHYSSYNTEKTVQLLRIAKKLGLTPSVGSDYHGLGKPTISLGRLEVPETLEAIWLEKLKNRPGTQFSC